MRDTSFHTSLSWDLNLANSGRGGAWLMFAPLWKATAEVHFIRICWRVLLQQLCWSQCVVTAAKEHAYSTNPWILKRSLHASIIYC